jgi:hypothetical protein
MFVMPSLHAEKARIEIDGNYREVLAIQNDFGELVSPSSLTPEVQIKLERQQPGLTQEGAKTIIHAVELAEKVIAQAPYVVLACGFRGHDLPPIQHYCPELSEEEARELFEAMGKYSATIKKWWGFRSPGPWLTDAEAKFAQINLDRGVYVQYYPSLYVKLNLKEYVVNGFSIDELEQLHPDPETMPQFDNFISPSLAKRLKEFRRAGNLARVSARPEPELLAEVSDPTIKKVFACLHLRRIDIDSHRDSGQVPEIEAAIRELLELKPPFAFSQIVDLVRLKRFAEHDRQFPQNGSDLDGKIIEVTDKIFNLLEVSSMSTVASQESVKRDILSIASTSWYKTAPKDFTNLLQAIQLGVQSLGSGQRCIFDLEQPVAAGTNWLMSQAQPFSPEFVATLEKLRAFVGYYERLNERTQEDLLGRGTMEAFNRFVRQFYDSFLQDPIFVDPQIRLSFDFYKMLRCCDAKNNKQVAQAQHFLLQRIAAIQNDGFVTQVELKEFLDYIGRLQNKNNGFDKQVAGAIGKVLARMRVTANRGMALPRPEDIGDQNVWFALKEYEAIVAAAAKNDMLMPIRDDLNRVLALISSMPLTPASAGSVERFRILVAQNNDPFSRQILAKLDSILGAPQTQLPPYAQPSQLQMPQTPPPTFTDGHVQHLFDMYMTVKRYRSGNDEQSKHAQILMLNSVSIAVTSFGVGRENFRRLKTFVESSPLYQTDFDRRFAAEIGRVIGEPERMPAATVALQPQATVTPSALPFQRPVFRTGPAIDIIWKTYEGARQSRAKGEPDGLLESECIKWIEDFPVFQENILDAITDLQNLQNCASCSRSTPFDSEVIAKAGQTLQALRSKLPSDFVRPTLPVTRFSSKINWR